MAVGIRLPPGWNGRVKELKCWHIFSNSTLGWWLWWVIKAKNAQRNDVWKQRDAYNLIIIKFCRLDTSGTLKHQFFEYKMFWWFSHICWRFFLLYIIFASPTLIWCGAYRIQQQLRWDPNKHPETTWTSRGVSILRTFKNPISIYHVCIYIYTFYSKTFKVGPQQFHAGILCVHPSICQITVYLPIYLFKYPLNFKYIIIRLYYLTSSRYINTPSNSTKMVPSCTIQLNVEPIRDDKELLPRFDLDENHRPRCVRVLKFRSRVKYVADHKVVPHS